jgi:hypothetical protein
MSDNSFKPDVVQSIASNKILEIKDVDFPGDEKGNQIASLEAYIKASVNELTQEMRDDLVITTTDKLRNQLNEYQNILAGKTDWMGPAGMLIAFLPTLVAADFKDALSIKAATWEAIFILGFLGSIIWLIIVFFKVIGNRKKRNISSLIQIIKKRELK